MPESSTAQLMFWQRTLNKVRAASPFTDGTDRLNAGIALRFNETCQICGGAESGVSRISPKTSPSRFTIGRGDLTFARVSAAPTTDFFLFASVAAQRMMAARLT